MLREVVCFDPINLFQAYLELLYSLTEVDEIPRHRLEQLRQLRRQGSDGRRDVLCGLSRRCWLWRCCLRHGRLNRRWVRLRGEPRVFERQRGSRDELLRPPRDNLPGRIAVGRLRKEGRAKDA